MRTLSSVRFWNISCYNSAAFVSGWDRIFPLTLQVDHGSHWKRIKAKFTIGKGLSWCDTTGVCRNDMQLFVPSRLMHWSFPCQPDDSFSGVLRVRTKLIMEDSPPNQRLDLHTGHL